MDKDPDQLRQALRLLEKQKPLLLKYDSSTIEDLLLSGAAHIAQAWSGLGVRIQQNHPEFSFVLPEEGVPMFVDNFCIPHRAKNKRNAELFINHMLRPEISARNMSKLPYPMPNQKARELLPDDLRTLLDPLYEMDRLELIGDLGDFNKAVDRAWTELRSSRN